MLNRLAVLALPLFSFNVHALSQSDVKGVPPSLVAKYKPTSGGKWTCLDGKQTINWSAVNNDYCDCEDGSDEPGTGACPNTSFWCQNKGHIGSSIPSSRVNDGLCEEACCDGSDERPGLCPDRCGAIGEAYAQKKAEQDRIRKTGSKLRSSYIAFAQKEKTRLDQLIASTRQAIEIQEDEVKRAKERAERAESIGAEVLEKKKQSPLYISLKQHAELLAKLKAAHSTQKERVKNLGEILDGLAGGYNPNYQDMAVLAAVRAWDMEKGTKKSSSDESTSEDTETTETEEPEAEEEQIDDREIDDLLDTDLEALLLEHDSFGSTSASSSPLFNIEEYIPDAYIPQYQAAKKFILGILGVEDKSSEGATPEASAARNAFNDAEKALDHIQRQLTDAEKDYGRLFDPQYFGSSGEWRKLKDTCLRTDVGDYTYEVCLFGEAKQIPKHGGQTFSLGHFNSWETTPGNSLSAVQLYEGGAVCWNGPARKVILSLSCGIENSISTVAELQKCEYGISGTSPALCLPLDTPLANESRDAAEL